MLKVSRRARLSAWALVGLSGLILWLGVTARAQATPLGAVGPVARGPDASVWFAERISGGDAIGHVSSAGQIIRGAFNVGYVDGLTAGPDGNVWFASSASGADGAPRVGWLTPAGTVKMFDLPPWAGHVPFGIAAGPDGNLWFAVADGPGSEGAGAIGRVTPAGVVSEFSSGLLVGADPQQIAAGPDGALWFTDWAGRIGRITTAGSITEYTSGLSGARGREPYAIAAGPDGNLWFTESQRVGRITPAGAVRTFGRGIAGGVLGIGAITAGPDGNLWYAGGAGVGRVSPLGPARLFTHGYSSSDPDLGGIAVGADGDLWFGDNGAGGGHVDRITGQGAISEFPAPPPCVVPDLRGLGSAYAGMLLTAGFCRRGRITRAYVPRRGPRRRLVVVKQKAAPASRHKFDFAVALTLGPAPPRPVDCRLPWQAHVLARTKRIVVYEVVADVPGGEPDDTSQRIRTCARPRGPLRDAFYGESLLLSSTRATGVRAAGSFVAFAVTRADHYHHEEISLHLYDGVRGRETFSTDVERHFGDDGPDPINNPRLGDYVVNTHGYLAWIVTRGSTAALRLRDSHGLHTLDVGAIGGLSFRGDTLKWSNGGAAHRATVG